MSDFFIDTIRDAVTGASKPDRFVAEPPEIPASVDSHELMRDLIHRAIRSRNQAMGETLVSEESFDAVHDNRRALKLRAQFEAIDGGTK